MEIKGAATWGEPSKKELNEDWEMGGKGGRSGMRQADQQMSGEQNGQCPFDSRGRREVGRRGWEIRTRGADFFSAAQRNNPEQPSRRS
jgi:hypothetical protein